MKNTISISRIIQINSSSESALNFLQNIHYLSRYEPKVISAHVLQETSKTGVYTAWGFFYIIPWRGKFSYTLTENGFNSALLTNSSARIQVNGGFLVKSEDNNQCRITHYESYKIPNWLNCLNSWIKKYIDRSIERELNNIKCLIENQSSLK